MPNFRTDTTLPVRILRPHRTRRRTRCAPCQSQMKRSAPAFALASGRDTASGSGERRQRAPCDLSSSPTQAARTLARSLRSGLHLAGWCAAPPCEYKWQFYVTSRRRRCRRSSRCRHCRHCSPAKANETRAHVTGIALEMYMCGGVRRCAMACVCAGGFVGGWLGWLGLG